MPIQVPSEQEIAFGMACFAFEVSPEKREVEWSFDQWRLAVEEALSGLPNVTDVVVSVNSGSLRSTHWTPKRVPDQSNAPPAMHEFEPNLPDAYIRFEITLPKRLHPGLLDGRTHACERFRVETFYDYHGPATIVTCLDGVDDGSDAVVMLWRFLELELPKHTDRIAFTTLGPSPFHADGILGAGTEQPSIPALDWKLVSVAGYGNYKFTYSPEAFASIEDAHVALSHRLVHELSLFYRLVVHRNHAYEWDRYLSKKTKALVVDHQKTGARAAWRRVFSSAAPARQLGLDALQAKVRASASEETGMSAITMMYAQSGVLGCFEPQLTAQIVKPNLPVVENALEVVRFVEGGRTKEMEVAVVASSTLLGGVAGAVAALVAR